MTLQNRGSGAKMYFRDDYVDVFLAKLVEMANGGFEIGITLSCGGQLITGRLVGGRKYFKGFDETLIAGARRCGVDLPETLFAPMGDSYPDPAKPKRDREEESDPTETTEGTVKKKLAGYLHLQDAKIWQPIGQPIECGWWRGKLSAVDGFFLGEVSRDDEKRIRKTSED